MGIGVKGDTVIILDGGEPFVGYFDLTTSHHISFALLDHIIEFSSCFLEERRLNHDALTVHEINVEQTSLTTMIVPSPDVILLGNFDLDGPILDIGIETAQRKVISLLILGLLGRRFINHKLSDTHIRLLPKRDSSLICLPDWNLKVEGSFKGLLTLIEVLLIRVGTAYGLLDSSVLDLENISEH